MHQAIVNMLNGEDLKNNSYPVQAIPHIFSILSLIGFYFGIRAGDRTCREHLFRAFLLGWAVFILPCFARCQTALGDSLAVGHTLVVLYFILPFDLIFKAIGSARDRVTGRVRHELPRWETEKYHV